jgi:hypothetical protein
MLQAITNAGMTLMPSLAACDGSFVIITMQVCGMETLGPLETFSEHLGTLKTLQKMSERLG